MSLLLLPSSVAIPGASATATALMRDDNDGGGGDDDDEDERYTLAAGRVDMTSSCDNKASRPAVSALSEQTPVSCE